jgi:transcription initiation factor TFIID TATA-box-binding protein
MVKIVNISAGGDLHKEVDLEAVRDTVDLPFVDLDHTMNRLLLRYEKDGALFILFRTGKFILRGGDSFEGCYKARDMFYEILEDYGIIDSIKNIEFNIVNIVFVDSLNQEVDLSKLAVELGLDYTDYEPEHFPGLIYRPPDCSPTVTIYSTGNLTMTGARTVEEAENTIAKLRERIIDEHDK